MSLNETAILQALGPLLLGVVGWFMRSLMKDVRLTLTSLQESTKDTAKTLVELNTKILLIERDLKTISQEMESFHVILDNWPLMKRDLDDLRAESRLMNQVKEDLAVLKRDQQTMWRKIDEVKK